MTLSEVYDNVIKGLIEEMSETLTHVDPMLEDMFHTILEEADFFKEW